jgi:hypothetical protein
MKKKFSLVVVVLFSSIPCFAVEMISNGLNARETKPKEAFEYVHSDHVRWTSFLNETAAGNPKLLKFWPILRKVSDPESIEALDTALSKLLKTNVGAVLGLIDSNWANSIDANKLTRSVCSASREEFQETNSLKSEERTQKSLDAIVLRIDKVKENKDSGLKTLSNVCEQSLEREKKFFKKQQKK